MYRHAPFSEKALRHQRRATLLAAALIAACSPIDLGQPNAGRVWLLRAGWILAALFASWSQQRGRTRLAVAGGHVGGAATGLAVTSIVWLSGGTHSIYEGMFLASPFALLVAFPELPSAAAIAGAICAPGGLLVRWSEGQGAFELGAWVLLSTVMTVLAVFGTVMTRRLIADEVAAANARVDAMEALAESERARVESERRRAEAEALLEAGRLAAGVVHEMSSPLAALRTNLRSLAGEDLPPAERAEVLADAVEGVEKITDVVSALGRSIHPLEPRRLGE
ncbi:MAG: histidine kinase dimerization/phospho-acceptor domain-containing protein [Anaeromyxobacteraceae bacterium]